MVEGFGRPRIETWRVYVAAFGSSTAARGPTEKTRLAGLGDDPAALHDGESARGRDPGVEPADVFISRVEVTAENWSFGNGRMQYGPPAA